MTAKEAVQNVCPKARVEKSKAFQPPEPPYYLIRDDKSKIIAGDTTEDGAWDNAKRILKQEKEKQQ